MSVGHVDLSIYQFLYNECVSQVGAPTKIPSTWLILAYFSRDPSLFLGGPIRCGVWLLVMQEKSMNDIPVSL